MSRLRSRPGSNASSASRATATPRARGVLVQAPKSDIYVALLGIGLAAVIIACLLLALVMMRYEWRVSAAFAAPTPTAIAADPVQLAALPTVTSGSLG
ncbi:hypothetical protein [Paludisphaera rhizosphaerae]|uniref:hypothetical protein n=1 Tax=Paludisphaera rhizosphaerae TaxID=2711216 RepID=UPI0013EBEF69|nr:hypothetical protein [Paludisphaera rhizosphaerae]